jgi:hypothetical protein
MLISHVAREQNGKSLLQNIFPLVDVSFAADQRWSQTDGTRATTSHDGAVVLDQVQEFITLLRRWKIKRHKRPTADLPQSSRRPVGRYFEEDSCRFVHALHVKLT